MNTPKSFWEQAAKSLRFDYDVGGVTTFSPEYDTNWRVLPYLLVMQVTGAPVVFELEDRRLLAAMAGEAICISPGMRHRAVFISYAGNASRWSHVNFWILDALNLATLIPLNGTLRGPVAMRLGDINAELAAQEFPEEEDETKCWPMWVKRQALGMEIAALLVESFGDQPAAGAKWQAMGRLLPVLAYIEEHLGEPMHRDELAKQVHLSPSHFAALFKDALGIAPGEYARRQQVRRAQHLLLTTTLGVGQVARSCGFGDEFHFSRFFKSRLGVSPAYYRRRMNRSQYRGF